MPAIQPTPVQSQPVDEVGNAPDRVWYRFWDSIKANALVFVDVPVHSDSAGTVGQVAFSSNFFYVCVATNSWKRVAIGSVW